jgi:tetratricopeptide (TPR) repeat protein
MRLPGFAPPTESRIRFARRFALGLLCFGAMVLAARAAAQQSALPSSHMTSDQLRTHDSEQWREVEAHLPNPATSTPQALEEQADILRARRFPEDALNFYNYAMARGGNAPVLMNKLGLTELEMKNVELARAYFKRSVKLNPKNADVWNNLGAVEYLDRGASIAVQDYKRAIKLNKHQAVFHANLATAYFEMQNYKGARREMASAMSIEPDIFDQRVGTGGIQAHVLTSEDRARFSYEMARMYAHNQQQEQMLHSLAQACEFGMDIQREMRKDEVLAQYENDPRVAVIVHNALLIRTGHADQVSASSSEETEPSAAKPVSE